MIVIVLKKVFDKLCKIYLMLINKLKHHYDRKLNFFRMIKHLYGVLRKIRSFFTDIKVK